MFDYNTMDVKVEPGGVPHWHVTNPVSLTWWSWNACGKQAKIRDLPAVSTPQKLKSNTTAAKTESMVRATTCACCIIPSTPSPLPKAWGTAAVLLHQHSKSLILWVSTTPKSFNNKDGPNPLLEIRGVSKSSSGLRKGLDVIVEKNPYWQCNMWSLPLTVWL